MYAREGECRACVRGNPVERQISMVVQDLPRQAETRKGLLKAIHRLMANGVSLTRTFVTPLRRSLCASSFPKERRLLQKKEPSNCLRALSHILHISATVGHNSSQISANFDRLVRCAFRFKRKYAREQRIHESRKKCDLWDAVYTTVREVDDNDR